ncbi:MAG: TonB-dependent receptor plug domain-containing protein [Woeseiaceae bacterium]|nr:TonB-dependent receptor plug domain-containing protein [Woeseiaceae bacterium]
MKIDVLFTSRSVALRAFAVSVCFLLAPIANAQIEEIVVTAEKREESLQDVSISVTAFTEEALELGGIDDVSRLELLVPGLNYAFAGNDAKFNVRGANSTNTFGDNSSIVGAFVDGVYKARASQQTRAFFDVRNVEFLRGPQGTLYGRNTFAGALNVYTHAPDTEEMSGGIEISTQAYDRKRGEVYFNMPRLRTRLQCGLPAFTTRATATFATSPAPTWAPRTTRAIAFPRCGCRPTASRQCCATRA